MRGKLYTEFSKANASSIAELEKGEPVELSNMTLDEIVQMQQSETKVEKEDYVAGCYKENYMKPHVCPVATGSWCKDYVKCRNLHNTLVK